MPKSLDTLLEIHNYSNDLAGGLKLQEACQSLGYSAWLDGLDRSEEEIRQVFGSNESAKNFEYSVSSIYYANKRAGDHGASLALRGSGIFLAASLPEVSTTPVGYIFARDNRSGSLAHRMAEAYMLLNKPYAWVQSLNVDPRYQSHGIGSALLFEAMQHFDIRQRPTAYVFDENHMSLAFFKKYGFEAIPKDQEPQLQAEYFGQGTEPPLQWRLQAQNVLDVRRRITSAFKKTIPYEIKLHKDS